MSEFIIDKLAIREASERFRQALLYWKSEEKVRGVVTIHRPYWKEEDIAKSVQYCEGQVAPILEAFDPIYNLAIAGDIDEPFDLSGYMTSKVGRILGDELSYPEITEPYNKIIEALRGGLSHQEFYKTEYYKLHLMPKKFNAK
ncbi:hypothetical protein [Glaciimonas soli]|uniref:Uncharacterized protein n=1 Tax=Glaciimonas soli TaxID=2590999 RepID=A0A843Z141_9BURK|nr:hypothetical protein [Glaciimonas soli]MQR02576.1 hypothetical protein [Glaciimonas soli]